MVAVMWRYWGVARWAVGVVLLTALLACGGGGGGTSSSSNTSQAQIVATPASLAHTAAVNASSMQSATISLQFLNMPDTVVNIAAARLVTGALSDFEWASFSRTAGEITVWFDPPASLAPGTYTDRVRIFACSSVDCSSTLDSIQTIVPVEYTVTAASPAPEVTFSENPIVLRALSLDTTVQVENIALVLSNFSEVPYLSIAESSDVISSANVVAQSTMAGQMKVYFEPPSTLAAGEYSTTLTVTACLDANCMNPVSGSPFQIPVTYTVGDAINVSGAYGYVLRAVELNALNLSWSEAQQTMYVVLPGDNMELGYLAALDPASGIVSNKVATTAELNGTMDVSSDGTYLYVGLKNGTIERYALPSLTPDLSIPLGTNVDGDQRYPADIRVSPVSATTVAVTLSGGANMVGYGNYGAGIFDGVTQRPNYIEGNSIAGYGVPVNYLTWNSDGVNLYGTQSETLNGFVFANVDLNGVSMTDFVDTAGTQSEWIFGRPHWAGGLLYSDNGQVYDATAQTWLEQLMPFGDGIQFYNLNTDAGLDRIFVVGDDPDASGRILVRSVGMTSGQVIADVYVPPFIGSSVKETSLIRWGDDGLGFIASGMVLLVSGNFATH